MCFLFLYKSMLLCSLEAPRQAASNKNRVFLWRIKKKYDADTPSPPLLSGAMQNNKKTHLGLSKAGFTGRVVLFSDNLNPGPAEPG